MFRATGIAAVCAVCAAPAIADERQDPRVSGAHPLPHSFDLALVNDGTSEALSFEDAAMPAMPDKPIAAPARFTPPAMSVRLMKDGPVLAVGAMGAKFRDAPRLAHVAIGMDF